MGVALVLSISAYRIVGSSPKVKSDLGGSRFPNLDGARLPNLDGSRFPNLEGSRFPNLDGSRFPNLGGISRRRKHNSSDELTRSFFHVFKWESRRPTILSLRLAFWPPNKWERDAHSDAGTLPPHYRAHMVFSDSPLILGGAVDWVRYGDAESLKHCDVSWVRAQAVGSFAICQKYPISSPS